MLDLEYVVQLISPFVLILKRCCGTNGWVILVMNTCIMYTSMRLVFLNSRDKLLYLKSVLLVSKQSKPSFRLVLIQPVLLLCRIKVCLSTAPSVECSPRMMVSLPKMESLHTTIVRITWVSTVRLARFLSLIIPLASNMVKLLEIKVLPLNGSVTSLVPTVLTAPTGMSILIKGVNSMVILKLLMSSSASTLQSVLQVLTLVL